MATMHDIDLQRGITEREAAEFLGYSVRALQNWRHRGGGPPFVKGSDRSVRYRKADLIKWMDRRTVQSTSEATEQFGA